MRNFRYLSVVAMWGVAFALTACGGGGDGSSGSSPGLAATGNNVLALTVNSGPTGNIPNLVTTSVTVCTPGTTSCQTISNVMVDTGSTGLRLLASALGSVSLPAVPSRSGSYSECAGFADGTVWGAVALADVQMAGEKASGVAVHVIQDNGVGAPVPASCSNQGANEDSASALGANGILGVGPLLQDCGTTCASAAEPMYYDCTSAGACTESTIALASQVGNPAAALTQDNNGVILQLAAVSDTGSPSSAGNLIFGIGTQSNNGQSATVIPISDIGTFTATFNGVSLPNSFFDSGSSVYFFNDSSIPQCPTDSEGEGFFCPGSASALSSVALNVSISASNGSLTAVPVIANAEFLFDNNNNNFGAYDDLAAPAGTTLGGSFDFGVPFFFGKSVFTAFEQRTTPAGAGPYFAFQPLQ